MKLDNIVIAADVIRSGTHTTVGDAFRECLQHNVSCIPAADASGHIIGRFSIRETLRIACIPEVAINYADLLGDNLGEISLPEEHACKLAGLPADHFILPEFVALHSVSPVIKAITLMEKHATDSVFVIDDGVYRGVVTIEGIARRMLQISND